MNQPNVMETIDSHALAGHRRETSQLRRLETLTDVVYGIAIWRVFMLFPRPDEPAWSWHSWREFFAAEGMTVVLIAIGVAVLIIYWLQSNTLFSLVERADGKFAVRAIMQLFFVLLFLFSIRVGTELPASAWTRAIAAGSDESDSLRVKIDELPNLGPAGEAAAEAPTPPANPDDEPMNP